MAGAAKDAAPTGPAPKAGIPRNPGRGELGMKATLLFPSREVVEQYYVPLIYTACRTCYSELAPEEIFRRAAAGEIEPAKMQRAPVSGQIKHSLCSSTCSRIGNAAARREAKSHAR